MIEPLDELLAAWRTLAEAEVRRECAGVRARDRKQRQLAEVALAAGMARLDLAEQRWRRAFACADDRRAVT